MLDIKGENGKPYCCQNVEQKGTLDLILMYWDIRPTQQLHR